MTLALQTQKLVDAAHGHSTLIQAMGKNKLAQRFADEKKALKNFVHEAIDNRHSKAAVMKQMPKLPNPMDATKDRFTAKVNRYFKKHKVEAPKVKTEGLFPKMAQAANILKDTYVNDIDKGSNIATEEKPAVIKNIAQLRVPTKRQLSPC